MNTKITKETIIGTALTLTALINQILTMIGNSPLPFEDEFIKNAVSIAFLLVTTAYSWWHNNSLTSAAQLADNLMHSVKNGALSEDKLKELITWTESDGEGEKTYDE